MSSLKEIEERQQRMYQLIDRMVAEEDMNAMLQLVQALENEARELEAAGKAFQAKMDKQYGKPAAGGFDVVLTPEQRARVLKETGVTMDVVHVPDVSGSMNAAMPYTAPPQIEAIALQQALEQKTEREAREASRNRVEQMLRELESQNELVAAQVANLRQDPQFREQMGLDDKKR
jgi:hypothetical protein